MSLLLEALKKAELAKQVAKAEAPTPDEPAPFEPSKSVMTRERLPDITQPLEILTDDLPSSESKEAGTVESGPELSLQEPETFEPSAQPFSPVEEPARVAERAQAQQLFQVKEMDYNPRRPFYLTLGALALVGLGYGGYVWWQMRPKPSFAAAERQPPITATVQPAPLPAPSITPAAINPAPATPAPVAQAVAPAPARTGNPVIPPIQPARPPRPRSQPAPASGQSGQRGASSDSIGTASPRAGTALAPIAINAATLSLDPQVEQGYQALQRNDLAGARDGYQRALAREPTNRDALLGLAAIDVRSGQPGAAEARYLKLLEMDPRDSQAAASLIALRGQLDPVAAESRLKTFIASQPEAAQLHFTLGNQYAQQSRWNEAQAAYFKAYSVDPENADYAFNLAISLDQLRQKKLALEYYQRSLALSEKRAASFDPAQARSRVQELSK